MLVLGGGIVLGVLNVPKNNHETSQIRMGLQEFTNPLLECEVGSEAISSSKEDFSADLAPFLDTLKEKLRVSEIAVYFRDLNNGPIIGIGQNIPFAPASLLKLPIMMSYLSHAEDNPGSLDKKIEFKHIAPLLPDQQDILSEKHIEVGRIYSINELIEYMIKYSDNQAMVLLYEGLPIAEQIDLYTRIGVDSRALTDATKTLSVKQYSIFFRVLFNASYLSRKDSERALKLLAETNFDQGLRAGVPRAIPVAHKFGERQFGRELQQLHDCGIVYYPGHPYLLCIMTRGSETTSLTKAIVEVSKFVYGKIDTQYGR